jgi:excisionase family DNA binding protein
LLPFAENSSVSAPIFGIRSANSGDQLLKVREVAQMLSVSTATVYGLIKRGKLAAVQLSGSLVRVPAVAVAAILKPTHER